MLAPSPFIMECLSRLKPGNTVLDLACGKGRHTRACLERGHKVTAVDIDKAGLDDIAGVPDLRIIPADLENGPWPLDDQTFDLVIVANYLWRPLLPRIGAAVKPLGILCYETFAVGNERYGKPSRSEFLLKKDELLQAYSSDFRTMHYSHGTESDPTPAVRQRYAGQKKRVGLTHADQPLDLPKTSA